jgi:hypothetical protein
MLSVANKPIMRSVIMLNVIMPSVIILSVMAPHKHKFCKIKKFLDLGFQSKDSIGNDIICKFCKLV